jgi:hypothetical protein
MPMSRNRRHSRASLGFGFTKKRRSEIACLTHEAKIGCGGVAGHLFHAAARVSLGRHKQIFVINHPVFIRNLYASLWAAAGGAGARAARRCGIKRPVRANADQCGPSAARHNFLPQLRGEMPINPRREGSTIFNFPLRV